MAATMCREATGRRVTIAATDPATGEAFRWQAYRAVRWPSGGPLGWVLVDGEGCERFHGGNWTMCAPYFRQVIENHGLTANLS